MSQWDFTAPFEGVVPHLYLDTRGNPTCGVGFMIASEAELVRLPWWPNAQEAIADFRLLKTVTGDLNHPASSYQRLVRARLREDGMRAVFDAKIAALRKALEPGWQLSHWPESVQIALMDMGYNLGVVGLAKFRRLHLACFARNWRIAADECHRGVVQTARNEATRGLFLSAIE